MHSSVLIRNNSSTIKFIYGAVSRNSSRICVYRSAKSNLYKTIKKKNTGHPDIYGPCKDCGWCGGKGCGHC